MEKSKLKWMLEDHKKFSHLCTKSTEKCVPEVTQRECKVFVEEVTKELAHAVVTPPAVDQKQSLEVAELGNRVVTGENGLKTLLA